MQRPMLLELIDRFSDDSIGTIWPNDMLIQALRTCLVTRQLALMSLKRPNKWNPCITLRFPWSYIVDWNFAPLWSCNECFLIIPSVSLSDECQVEFQIMLREIRKSRVHGMGPTELECNTTISDSSASLLSCFNRIKRLVIRRTFLNEHAFIDILLGNNFRHITVLEMTDCPRIGGGIYGIDIRIFCRMRALRELTIEFDCFISMQGFPLAPAMQKMQKLQKLCIANDHSLVKYMPELQKVLTNNSSLQHLSFKNCALKDFKFLNACSYESLSVLHIQNDRPLALDADGSVEAIVQLRYLKELRFYGIRRGTEMVSLERYIHAMSRNESILETLHIDGYPFPPIKETDGGNDVVALLLQAALGLGNLKVKHGFGKRMGVLI
eukprot:766040-Hanusia_phi.AAC.3